MRGLASEFWQIVLFVILGAIAGWRLRAIRRYAMSEKVNPSEWNLLTQSAFLKVSLNTRIWIVMGTVLLTAAKPGLRDSIVIIASSLILGLLFSFVSFKHGSAVSNVQAGSR